MKNNFLSLSKKFILRHSFSESILQNIESGATYKLEKDQIEFIYLLDGTNRFSDIKAMYSRNSISKLTDILKNLKNLNAVEFLDYVQKRTFVKNKVPDRRLESVHLEASGVCNMKCVHCYQGNLIVNKDKLDFKTIISLLDQMQKMQVSNIGISGGEPLMMKNLFYILKEVEKRSIRISALFTNGTLINENFVKNILSLFSKFTIFVSLDSIPGNSFTFRGFSKNEAGVVLPKIIQNIKLLVTSGLNVTINTVVNAENINYLDQMYSIIKNLNVKSWRLGFPKQTLLFKENSSSFNVDWDIIAKKCFVILENHLANKKPFDLQIEYLYRETLFNQGLHELHGNDYVCDYEGRRGECCIKPNGDVVSCAYCNEIPVGNILLNSLSEIWYSNKMQSIKMIRIDTVKECVDCEIRSICGTGCRANAHFLHGDFYNSKDDYACRAVKFFTKEVSPLLVEYGYKSN